MPFPNQSNGGTHKLTPSLRKAKSKQNATNNSNGSSIGGVSHVGNGMKTESKSLPFGMSINEDKKPKKVTSGTGRLDHFTKGLHSVVHGSEITFQSNSEEDARRFAAKTKGKYHPPNSLDLQEMLDASKSANDNIYKNTAPGKSNIPNTGKQRPWFGKNDEKGPNFHINNVKDWHDQNVIDSPGNSVSSTDAYMNYCDHCERNQVDPLGLPNFLSAWSAHAGIMKQRIAGRTRHIGIDLKKNDLEEGAPMPPLTRRVLKQMLSQTKHWQDGARNNDEFFKATNIKATSAHPNHPPLHNAEDYEEMAIHEGKSSFGRSMISSRNHGRGSAILNTSEIKKNTQEAGKQLDDLKHMFNLRKAVRGMLDARDKAKKKAAKEAKE